ncbi:zinc knuckle (CCHC-type) family protein [Striga asiatica]|uniref:Zinc knuckle (CCHC-type) family protein n=1 Tax=Striga asiatica TaxID=4170 RepID=A0A5A7RB72_STRAF|nr:zinc knuckle (CCHC-type) family protein [Striga asiatica]
MQYVQTMTRTTHVRRATLIGPNPTLCHLRLAAITSLHPGLAHIAPTTLTTISSIIHHVWPSLQISTSTNSSQQIPNTQSSPLSGQQSCHSLPNSRRRHRRIITHLAWVGRHHVTTNGPHALTTSRRVSPLLGRVAVVPLVPLLTWRLALLRAEKALGVLRPIHGLLAVESVALENRTLAVSQSACPSPVDLPQSRHMLRRTQGACSGRSQGPRCSRISSSLCIPIRTEQGQKQPLQGLEHGRAQQRPAGTTPFGPLSVSVAPSEPSGPPCVLDFTVFAERGCDGLVTGFPAEPVEKDLAVGGVGVGQFMNDLD